MRINNVKEARSPAHPMSWERYFPLISAMARNDWAYAATQFSQPSFQQDPFIDFLVFHDLWPFLYHAIENEQAARHCPAWLVMHLVGLNTRECARAKQWGESLLELARAAKMAEIELITLKGYHFALRFYGDGSARRARDLDVLVRPDAFMPIVRVMKKLGYRDACSTLQSGWLRKPFTHAIEMERAGFVVDIHLCIRKRPAYHIDMEKIWRAKSAFSLARDADVELFGLSDEDTLVMLIASITGDIEQGHVRGKSFLDLYTVVMYLEGRVDWSAFLQARSEENLLAISVNVFAFMLLLFECGERCPNLATVVEEQRSLVLVDDYEHALRLIGAPKHNAQNRLWFLRLYPGSKVHYLFWLAAGVVVKPQMPRHIYKGVGLILGLIKPRFF